MLQVHNFKSEYVNFHFQGATVSEMISRIGSVSSHKSKEMNHCGTCNNSGILLKPNIVYSFLQKDIITTCLLEKPQIVSKCL